MNNDSSSTWREEVEELRSENGRLRWQRDQMRRERDQMRAELEERIKRQQTDRSIRRLPWPPTALVLALIALLALPIWCGLSIALAWPF